MGRYTVSWITVLIVAILSVSSCSVRDGPQIATPTSAPLARPLPIAEATSAPQPTTAATKPTTTAEATPTRPIASTTPLIPTSTPNWEPVSPEAIIAQARQNLQGELLLSSRQLCPSEHPIALFEQWSADKRYLALTYEYARLLFVSCIFDSQSGTLQPVGRGYAVACEWSPSADRLLVNEQAFDVHTYILDATTGITVGLPVKAIWEPTPYSPNPGGVGQDGAWQPSDNNTGMSWSHDGSRIAISTPVSLVLLDADRLWASGGRKAIQRAIKISLIGRPRWSDDDTFILSAKVVVNPNSDLHPSSEYSYQNVRINTHTSAIQELPNQ